MKSIIKDISNGKDVEINISKYAHKMMELYSESSFIRLSMNYFTYYEIVSDMGNKSDKLKSIVNNFSEIIQEGILNGADFNKQEVLVKTDKIRNEVIDIMKGLTSYIDSFNIYEYCLNRVQYRFEDSSELLSISDEELTADVMSYIVSEEDNFVINSKIVEIVRQLPIRMTKSKFFEYLTEGIKVYTGSEKCNLDDFLYMLKTSSMLEKFDGANSICEDVDSVYEEFKAFKFAEINKEKYDDLSAKLKFVATFLEESVSTFMLLEELINDVYVILLAKPYIKESVETTQLCKKVISTINKRIVSEDFVSVYEDIAEEFEMLEGEQEKLYNKIYSSDHMIDSIKNEYTEILEIPEISNLFVSLEKIALLVSGSIFVEFTKKDSSIADETYILKVTNELIALMQDFFGKNEKIVNRAVMAHTLAGLPVFFNNLDEISEFVSNGLKNCSDEAEKAAVIEIFKGEDISGKVV